MKEIKERADNTIDGLNHLGMRKSPGTDPSAAQYGDCVSHGDAVGQQRYSAAGSDR